MLLFITLQLNLKDIDLLLLIESCAIIVYILERMYTINNKGDFVARYPFFRKLLLLTGNMFLAAFSMWLAVQVVNHRFSFVLNTDMYWRMLPLNVVVVCLSFGVYDLYSLAKKRYGEIFIGIALSVFYTFIAIMAASFLFREFSFSRSVLLITAVLELILMNAWQYTWWRLERYLDEPKNALLLGSNEECQRVLARLQAAPQMNYNVRKIMSQDVEKQEWLQSLPQVDLVIICQDISLKKKAAIVMQCQQMDKKVVLVPSVYELFCSGLEINKIDDMPFFRPQYLNPSLERRSLKRLFDIFFSLFALTLTFVPMALIAVLIKLDSKGPVFYRQIRTGRYGEEFAVFKFRSMRQDAEASSGPVMAGEDDPRITKIGHILRAMRLDELPQFINVLRGDMSIVGPRPERPFFVNQFQAEIPEYRFRHNVRPGITGMAQVYGKYNTTVYDKLVYDLMYVQKCDFFTDLVIIIQTVRVLFQKSSTEGVK